MREREREMVMVTLKGGLQCMGMCDCGNSLTGEVEFDWSSL